MRNETGPAVNLWNDSNTTAVLMETHGTSNGHSGPMTHDKETTHDENVQQSENDAIQDYSVEHENEEDKICDDEAIYLVDSEK